MNTMENKEIVELETKTLAVDEQARAIVIKSQEEYDYAGNFLKAIKGLQKQVKDTFREVIAKTFAAHKEAKAAEAKHLEPLLEAEEFVKTKMVNYTDAQEELRRIEQAKLERKAEEERRIKQAQEEMWRRKEEAQRKEAERLASEGKAEEAKKAQAEADKAAAKADERAYQQQNIIAPVAASKVETVKGISYRDQWYGEVVNFKLLPDQYKIADMNVIDRTLNAQKGTLPIPGVIIKVRKIVASRAT